MFLICLIDALLTLLDIDYALFIIRNHDIEYESYTKTMRSDATTMQLGQHLEKDQELPEIPALIGGKPQNGSLRSCLSPQPSQPNLTCNRLHRGWLLLETWIWNL